MANAHNAKPWLIPAFATPQAVDACLAQGVRCTPIGTRMQHAAHPQHRNITALEVCSSIFHVRVSRALIGAQRLQGRCQPALVEALRA